MEFKTKDLLVTVLPKPDMADKELAKVCLLRTVICRNPTIHCAAPSLCFTLTRTCHGNVTFCRCTNYITWGCRPISFDGCTVFLSCGGPGGSACDPTYITCFGGSRDPFVIEHLEDLVSLRGELQATLKSLDAIQKEGLPSAISSKTDAETLERGLTEALERVRAAKKNL